MAAGNWIMYDSAKGYVGDATIDLSKSATDGEFTVALMTGSYTPAIATHSLWGDAGVSTNELTGAGSYSAFSVTSASVSWSETATNPATWTWDFTVDPNWTASGASFDATQYAIIYADYLATPLDPLICYCQLDSTAITVTDGDTLTIQINASGILTLSGAGS